MATLEFFTSFCLFCFLLPHIACKKCHQYQSTYNKSDHNPIVHFPFRLKGHQPQHCGYSNSFDLSCNEKKQTVLTLPSSSEDLIVEAIHYGEQSLWIHDQNKCILKRMLDNDFTLAGSPFHYDTTIVNYTFFSCTPQAPILLSNLPIDCLSSDNYNIIAMESTSSLTSPPSSCDVIFIALLPFVDSYELHDPDSGVRLAWGAPNCRSCESTGRVCGFKNVRNKQLHCSPAPATDHGFSSGFSYGLKFPRFILCFGAPELMLITGLVLYILTFIRDRVKPPKRMTELSFFGNEQPHVVITGLDDLTIESYPTTQLGERWEFPKPDDSACPICLCKYKSEETLRFIPECDHHFHADCIDEWLRKNKTCPVCRKTPPENDKTSLALLRHEY